MRRVIVALLAVVGLVVAACAEKPAQAENRADSFFVQRMILHNAQAVAGAGLVDGRTTTPAVLDLAKRIREKPATESAQLTQWVQSWGEVPHVSDASVPGTITLARLDKVRGATAQKFDSAWLDLMTVHHLGAIAMAETELKHGVRAEAKAFAQQVIDTRQPVLDVMQGMNGG